MKKIFCAFAAFAIAQSELVLDQKTKADIQTGRDIDKLVAFLLRPAVPIGEVIMNESVKPVLKMSLRGIVNGDQQKYYPNSTWPGAQKRTKKN